MSSLDETIVNVEGNMDEITKAKKEGNGKRKPVRMFPLNTLEEALKVPQVICEQNAGNPWEPKQIADVLNIGANNNSFFYQTSSARDYGLTLGTSRAKSIELAPIGRRICFPVSAEDEALAKKEAFFNIDVFKKVFEYYKATSLPDDKYFANTLKEKFDVDEKFCEDFIDIYKKNLEYLCLDSRADCNPTVSSPPKAKQSIKSNNRIFVIMPFSEKTEEYATGYFDEVYSSLIVPAAAQAGYSSFTAQRSGSDVIHSTIVREIENAEVILADLTEHNPNVLFELGLAFAFRKKVALIRSTGTKEIFDVDNLLRVYDYDRNLWKSTVERDIPNIAKHIEATLQMKGDSNYLDILLGKSNKLG